jgi:outer membrane protein TolC
MTSAIPWDRDVPSQWWTLFGSDELNALVEAALAANPDLQAAEAGLRAARETAAAQRGALWPSVDLHFQPTRQKIANPLASPSPRAPAVLAAYGAAEHRHAGCLRRLTPCNGGPSMRKPT